ncbi:MAG TPA: PAS domain-containing protein [Candidatus Methylomirabilis sp.]|nr:PAS domain-containing protein [Candidatus Methylomirabilis sp.]
MTLAERIVQVAADAIIVADASGKITLWNAGAERLFGYPAAEALGQSLDLIIPEAQRKRHWIGYADVMRTGETKYGTQLLRVPAIRRDGSRFSIAFTVGLLKNGAGLVEGIFAVMRDDTERFQTEKTLRKRIVEMEEAVKDRPSS